MIELDIECAISNIPKDKLMSVADAVAKHGNFCSTNYFAMNGINFLEQMMPDDSIAKLIVGDRYSCYYTSHHLGTKFYRAVPTYILSDNIEKYFDHHLVREKVRIQMCREMACDPEWFVPDWGDLEANPIDRTLLGSGYVDDCDWGHSSIKQMAVELDNGDHLICHFNCYYSK